MQILLEAGLDVNAQGEYEDALYSALWHGCEKVMPSLLDARAGHEKSSQSCLQLE